MEKALTVIIPAYNVSQYIKQGMDSLLEEKSIIPYIDIIIVNDGSKDNTLEIAEEYRNAFPDSVRVIDKENGGHGSGINVGIEAAQGKYLKVLDGDDWVLSKGLKEIVSYIRENESIPDAIINPFEKVWENGKREVITFDNITPYKLAGFADVNRNGYTLPLHTVTFRTDIYRQNKIPKLDEKISYDDMEYILFPVRYINSIVFLKEIVYQYRLGLSGQSMNPAQMIKKLPMHTKVIESLAEFYRSNKDGFDKENSIYYKREFVNTLGTNCELRLLNNVSKDDFVEFLNKYKDFPIDGIKNKKVCFLVNHNCFGYSFIKRYANKKKAKA